MSKLGRYLLANSIRANLLVLVLVLLPFPFPGTVFAASLVGFITLQKGALRGLLPVAWAALPAVAAFWQWPSMTLHYDFSLLICAFTWLLSILFNWQKNWARLFECNIFIGFCYIAVLSILPEHVLVYVVTHFKDAVMPTLGQLVDTDMTVVQQVIDSKVRFLLGVFYFALSVVCTVYLMLARAWQFASVFPGQSWSEFYSIRVRRYVSVIMVVVAASAMRWHTDWLEAAAFIAVLPFLFVGFSLALYGCAQGGTHRYLRLAFLIIIFAVLLIIPPVAFALLGLIGFMDSWLNFRKLKSLSVFNK